MGVVSDMGGVDQKLKSGHSIWCQYCCWLLIVKLVSPWCQNRMSNLWFLWHVLGGLPMFRYSYNGAGLLLQTYTVMTITLYAISGLFQIKYNAVALKNSQFSQHAFQLTPHRSPVVTKYGVYFVSSKSDLTLVIYYCKDLSTITIYSTELQRHSTVCCFTVEVYIDLEMMCSHTCCIPPAGCLLMAYIEIHPYSINHPYSNVTKPCCHWTSYRVRTSRRLSRITLQNT